MLQVRAQLPMEQNGETFASDEVTMKEVQNAMWVQCESPLCLKWRHLSKADASTLDTKAPWYCFMNPDPHHNNCDDVEESYRQFESAVRKRKLKYVVSVLPPGSLVWAKLQGYCRWPGIVSPDPVGGRHVCIDYDGNPLSYHVEFLGKQHSHSWVRGCHTELYGAARKDTDSVATPGGSEPVQEAPKSSETGCQSRAKRRKKGPNWKSHHTRAFKQAKTSYKYSGVWCSVDDAIAEAEQILEQLPHSRLLSCIYKYIEEDMESEDQEKKKFRRRGRKPRKHRLSLSKSGSKNKGHGKAKDQEFWSKARKKTAAAKKSGIRESAVLKETLQIPAEQCDQDNSMTSRWMYRPNGKEDLTKHLSHSASLVGRTKEEKFAMDVQSYQENQVAFDQDLQQFMSLRGTVIQKRPVWQGMPISLYQLFLTVWDRGGYQQVCEQRLWSAVYREIIGQAAGHGGEVAKKCYQRNLLAYELWGTGKDCMPHVRRSPVTAKEARKTFDATGDEVPTERMCRLPAVETVTSQTRMPQAVTSCEEVHSKDTTKADESIQECPTSCDLVSCDEYYEGCSEDNQVEDILREMEDYGQQCTMLEEALSLADENAFSEEDSCSKHSSQILVSTACSYGQAVFPERCSQDLSNSQPDGSQNILHEMQSLHQELAFLECELVFSQPGCSWQSPAGSTELSTW